MKISESFIQALQKAETIFLDNYRNIYDWDKNIGISDFKVNDESVDFVSHHINFKCHNTIDLSEVELKLNESLLPNDVQKQMVRTLDNILGNVPSFEKTFFKGEDVDILEIHFSVDNLIVSYIDFKTEEITEKPIPYSELTNFIK